MGETESVDAPTPPESPSPKRRRSRSASIKLKTNGTFVAFAAWLIFLMYWLIFQAGTGYDIWQNLAITLGSFLFVAMLLGIVWSPGDWRTNLSIFMGVGWMIFIVVWWAFYAGGYSLYQNTGVLLLSFLVLVTVIPLAWMSKEVRIGIPDQRRHILSIGVFYGWMVFAIYWLLFQADTGYTFEQNATVGLLSFTIAYVVVIGSQYSEFGRDDTGYMGPVMGFIWLAFLVVWFHMFAVDFDVYQNFAVVLGSFLLGLLGVGAVVRNRIREVDRIDFED